MAEDLISSIFDEPAIKKQFDDLNEQLKTFKANLLSFKPITLGESTTSLKELTVQSKAYEATVSDLSAAQIKLLAINKEIDTATKNALAAQTKRNVLSTEFGKVLVEERVALQKANAEAKTQVQINESAVGSLDNINARLKKLRSEKGSIAPVTPEDIAAIEKLKKAINELEEDRKKLLDDRQAQANNVGNYSASAQIIVDALEKEKKKLEELEKTRIRVQNAGSTFTPPGGTQNRTTVTGFGGGGGNPSGISSSAKEASKELKSLDQQIEQSRTIIEGFSRVTEKPTFLNMAGNLGDSTKELKFFTKSLIELESQGQGNSEAAVELRKRLAELTDQIGDAKAEVKALSSDTRGFDLFASSVSFAADAFQTFAGAAVLAGASEEDAAEATKTLVAVQSVANGVKGIANELTTRGTAANKAYAFAQNQVSIAMNSTATASARLRAALITIGIGALIIGIGLLIANFSKIKDALSGATKETKAYDSVVQKSIESTSEQISQLTILVDRVKKGELSFREKARAVDDYNKTFGETLGAVKDYAELEKKLIASGADYIEYLSIKGDAEAAYQLAVESKKKALTSQTDENVGIGVVGKTLLALRYGGMFNEGGEYQTEVNKANQRIKNNAAADNERDAALYTKIADDARKRQDILAERLKLPVSGVKEEKKTKAKQTKEELDAEYEVYKIDQQRKIDILKDVVDDEKESFNSRLLFLQQYLVARTNLINRNESEEIERAKGDKKKLQVIEAKYNDERLRLAIEGQKKIDEFADMQGGKNAERDAERRKAINERLKAVLDKFAKETTEAQDKAAKDKLAKDKAAADAEIALQKKKGELIQQLAREVQDTLFQFIDDDFKRQEQDLDERKRLLDEETRRKISNVNQLGLSEVERVKQTAAIEKDAQFQSEQIEKRKRAIAVERAKFEKAASVASIIQSTAVAVIAALGSKPYTPANIGLALLVGSIGALQLARAISSPLPKYFKGTENAQKGPGIYGEIGRELVIPQSGKPYLSPGVATLTSFIGGEKIIPADITASILNATGMQRLASMDQSKAITQDSINGHLMGKMLGELKDLNRKSRIVISNSRDIKTTAWYQQQFKN